MVSALDPFGNPISLQHESSATAIHGFVEGFLGYTPRILEVLHAAEHDASLMAQACAAALCMFSEAPTGPPAARKHLQRALAAGLPCTDRERLFAAAIHCWVEGDISGAMRAHDVLAKQHPRDLVAIKLGQYHAFNCGEFEAMLGLAQQAVPAAEDIAWAHGLAAFGLEQCHQLDAAEASARKALALRADEPWAQHALAHVMLTQGRLREGADFMRAASAGWQGLTSFMRTHNWWHQALFFIELGDAAGALHLYDSQVWGVDKSYSQDQIGAVSLLARLECVGLDVGPRWQELAPWLAPRTADQVLPFLDLQYLYGLARAGRPEAAVLMANIERHATRRAGGEGAPTWRRVALPAARGMLAHARGQWGDAAAHLEQAMPGLAAIGGSHAQRDLFEQLLMDAWLRSGQLVTARSALQGQARAQPQSRRLQCSLTRLNDATGRPDESP